MAKAKGNFETSLSTLERIVAQLESGDLPLERALELFEEGVGLAGQCQSQLQEAERKVELLLRERGEIKVVPFDPQIDSSKTIVPSSTEKSRAPNTKIFSEDDTLNRSEELSRDKDDSIPF